MLQLRWLACVWAFLRGYFWLPCPLCKRPFAGFEGAEDGLLDTPGSGRMVCRDCGPEARRITTEQWAKWRENGTLTRVVPP